MKIFSRTILVFVFSLILASGSFISAQENTGTEKILLPDWAKEVKPAGEITKYYLPKYLRNGYTKDEVKKIYGEYVYLLNKFGGYSDENPNYYGRLYYMGLYGVIIGTFETSLQIANIFEKLPDDQIFYIKIKNGKKTIKTVADFKFETYVAPFKFVALYNLGRKEEAMKLYNDVIKPNIKSTLPWHTHTVAKILLEEGDIEGAEEIYDELFLYEGKKRSYLYSAGALESCSYYFKKGDYDKVIKIADIFLSMPKDPKESAKILYPDKDIKKIYKDHWIMAYTSLETYKKLALDAKNGKVIDMDNLKDGVYKNANRSLRGVPFEVTLTIKDGRISSVEAVQNPGKNEIYDDRAFAAKEIMTQRILDANDYNVDAIASATMASTSIRLGTMQGLIEASEK
ncbi:MAG: hypothetical protein CSA33_00880 [Desulfobulbus propionicus]|nr:MAG: hypothetical protein CSA33_00880 [Desulfobulbus propionicus]